MRKVDQELNMSSLCLFSDEKGIVFKNRTQEILYKYTRWPERFLEYYQNMRFYEDEKWIL